MKKCVLGELMEVTRGVSLAGKYYATSGEKVRLTLANFDYSNNCFKADTSKNNIYYTQEVDDRFLLHEGDIITPLTEQTPGLLGTTARIPESGKYIQSQDVALLRPFEDKLDPDFCFYLVSSKSVREQLGAMSQQTKIRHSSPDKIKACTVFLPDIAEQKKIGTFLSTIDRKIALNRKRIATLEAMAKEIYDYWFVQFDFPDAHGRPYKSSGGAMVYNPDLKREIPKGWKSSSLGGIMQIERNTIDPSTIPDQEIEHYSIPAFDENMYPAVCRASEIQSSKFKIDSEVVLLSKLNPKFKRIWDPPVIGDHSLCSTEFIVCKAKQPRDKPFIFEVLNSDSVQRYMIDGASSSTGSRSRFAAELLLDFPLAIPPQSVMDSFTHVARLSHTQIKSLRIDITNMTTLRDFLLPLLMNGQVNVG